MEKEKWPKNGTYQEVFEYCEKHDCLPMLTLEQFFQHQDDFPSEDEC
jgi:hypothetical protein